MVNTEGAPMNGRQAFALAGLLTATVLTGSVAVIGLAHIHTAGSPLSQRVPLVAPAAVTPVPTSHTAAEEMD
jgi:hypothetical protein